jgi:cytochrome bd ubiquinol oxidase subunit I
MIPDFGIQLPVLGNRWTLGVMFQAHLVVVAAIMGIAMIAPAAELIGIRRGGERWERLSHQLASISVHFFAFGATFAVFGLLLLFTLYPAVIGHLSSIFFWPLVVVVAIWLVMSVSVYAYYETWNRLANRRGLHSIIGWVFAGSTFLFISIITFITSYQLTPTDPASLAAAAFNPSWLTEVVHRHIGNLSYGGYLLAGYAGFQLLFFLKPDSPHREYYDWVGHVGLVIGLGLALLQPFAGWFYARQVQVASPGAFRTMMAGGDGMFVPQMLFFGGTLLLANVYLASAVRRGDGASPWPRRLVWIALASAILGIIPPSLPLGLMPFKYVALLGLFVASIVNLVIYLRAGRRFSWGRAPRGSATALAALSVTVVLLIVTMGVIRTSARGGDPIYQRMSPSQSQEIRLP